MQWLLDGSALLFGGALFNPSTGVWTPLPLHTMSQIAVGTEGRVAALVVGAGDPFVQILASSAEAPRIPLPAGTGSDGHWVHELVGDEVYVHVTSPETGESRCWSVHGAEATRLDTCLEGSFAEIDRILPAGSDGVVIDSHGEGHPGVDLLRWNGHALEPVPLPWQDLYPFGPLELLPRVDGSFDILTRCALGPERPCLQDDGAVPLTRWYRWTPGQAPVLRASGAAAEVLPDPSSDRFAWMKGDKICVQSPGERLRCRAMPRRIQARVGP